MRSLKERLAHSYGHLTKAWAQRSGEGTGPGQSTLSIYKSLIKMQIDQGKRLKRIIELENRSCNKSEVKRISEIREGLLNLLYISKTGDTSEAGKILEGMPRIPTPDQSPLMERAPKPAGMPGAILTRISPRDASKEAAAHGEPNLEELAKELSKGEAGQEEEDLSMMTMGGTGDLFMRGIFSSLLGPPAAIDENEEKRADVHKVQYETETPKRAPKEEKKALPTPQSQIKSALKEVLESPSRKSGQGDATKGAQKKDREKAQASQVSVIGGKSLRPGKAPAPGSNVLAGPDSGVIGMGPAAVAQAAQGTQDTQTARAKGEPKAKAGKKPDAKEAPKPKGEKAEAVAAPEKDKAKVKVVDKFQTPRSVDEKLESIEKMGSLEDDERFYEMVSNVIEKIKNKTDFDTIKLCMQLEIARKYIKDLIELRKAMAKQPSLKRPRSVKSTEGPVGNEEAPRKQDNISAPRPGNKPNGDPKNEAAKQDPKKKEAGDRKPTKQ